MKKLFYQSSIVLSALLLSAFICEYFGDKQEEKVRNAFYFLTNDSIPNYNKVVIDPTGVPYVIYSKQNGIAPGKQYNPTLVANQAIDLYHAIQSADDTLRTKQFRNCINWLAGHMTVINGYYLYQFNWQQPWYLSVKMPFTSALSSGRAIEAFTDAQKFFPSEDHLQYAQKLLRGFYLPIENGGFTYKEKDGWWFEEFADTNRKTPRILDGHIYCITGIREYFLLTKDDSAAYLIDQGLAALKQHLPDYDLGNEKVGYDIEHNMADKKYHMILAGQMKQVWEITKDTSFYRYYTKWNTPLQQPYVYRIFKEKNRSGILLYFLISFLLIIFLFTTRKLLIKIFKNKDRTAK